MSKISAVTTSLRTRDRLIKHRSKCKKLTHECPKCALLRLHEDMADLRYAVQHCESAGVSRGEAFCVITGVLHGGV